MGIPILPWGGEGSPPGAHSREEVAYVHGALEPLLCSALQYMRPATLACFEVDARR